MNIPKSVLFIGPYYAPESLDYYRFISKRGFQVAAQNFQDSILDGFSRNDVDFKTLSIPPLSTFPQGCKALIIKDRDVIIRNENVGKSFGFINFPLVNHLHQHRIDTYIDSWYFDSHSDKTIVVYAMLKHLMQYAVAAKERHPDIKLCLVIPDLPLYMNCNKYYKMLGLQKRDMAAIDSLVHEFDSYVVLAEPMVDYLGIADKPCTVVEGIYSNQGEKDAIHKTLEHKTIMYAGGIQTRYGVFDLIEAFHRIKDEDYRLIMCGGCLEMDKLNRYLQMDNRISYLGMIPTMHARKLQKEVSLLVNPRHSTEDFTKYSFPSKTMEYMASGTPVLMTPLPSMPEEYRQHVYLFDDESVDGMKSRMETILSLPQEELTARGDGARNFILKQKNSCIQVRKILDLISKL